MVVAFGLFVVFSLGKRMLRMVRSNSCQIAHFRDHTKPFFILSFMKKQLCNKFSSVVHRLCVPFVSFKLEFRDGKVVIL